MSDAGDEIQVDAPEVEVSQEAPKGKMSVEDALKVTRESLDAVCEVDQNGSA